MQSDLPPRMIRRVRERKDGSRWVSYYYQTPGVRTKIPLGGDLLVAKAKWAELEGKVPVSGTVSEIRARHLKSDGKLCSPRTQADRTAYWKQLEPVFGAVQMDTLRPHHMLAYFDARSAKHSAKKELKYLSVLCSWARSRGLMTAAHPLVGGTLLQMKVKGGRTVYVEDDDFQAVYDHAHPILQDYMDLLYLTGQRPADVRKLTWADLKDGHAKVRQGKTEAKLRIEVVGELAEVLGRIKARGVQSMTVLCDERGQSLKAFGWLRSHFDAARKAAGVSFQFRDLRAKTASDA